jgi:hypothetical protein
VTVVHQNNNNNKNKTKHRRQLVTMPRLHIADHYYFDMYWTTETCMMEQSFKETTAQMTDDEYISTNALIMKEFESYKHNVKYTLLDLTTFFHEVSPESQKLIDYNSIQFFNNTPLQKVAIVLPQSILELMSIEDTVNNLSPTKYKLEYCSDNDNAKQWLFSP